MRGLRTRRSKLIAAAAVVVAIPVGLYGGTWVYIHVIKDDPPPPLSFDDFGTLAPSTG